jgi:chemotaxis protein MotB
MSDDVRPIVIKRIKKVAAGHHGGAWKIAYADFVTAMMAFFLLMWLLGSTASGDLKGIADYFQNPLKIASTGRFGDG